MRLFLSVQGKGVQGKGVQGQGVQGQGAAREVVVDGVSPAVFLIGRDPNAQLFLGDPHIGRRHCEIVLDGQEFILRPISEKGQTLVNGDLVDSPRALRPGDVLSIGSVAIVVRAERETRTPPTESRVSIPEPERSSTTPKLETATPSSPGIFAKSSITPNLQSKVEVAPHVDGDRTMVAPGELEHSGASMRIRLGNDDVTIGRDASCTVTIDDLMVSRKHARVATRGGKHVVEDIGSTNGVFVNGQRISERTPLAPGDHVDIGPYRLEYTGRLLVSVARGKGTTIVAAALGKRVTDRITAQPMWLLKNVNLSIKAGEFVGLMGQSGCGKSTFMDAINGRRPGTQGGVYYDGEKLYRNFASLKGGIGYVPQQVIFHNELPLEDALRYSSRLRLSKDISAEETEENIERVLDTVELKERRRVRIRDLSGGQQKRVPIAMELLSQPRTLFLDEVTSGLDMGTERRMMDLFRKLADTGMTVICITHFVDSLDIADRIAYFNKGRLCYFGSPKRMKEFFVFQKLSDIYAMESDRRESPAELEERFQLSSDCHEFVDLPEDIRRREQAGETDEEDSTTLRLGDIKEGIHGLATVARPFIGHPERVITLIKRPSDFKRQLAVLVKRYRQIFTQDGLNLLILTGLAPLIAVLLTILAGSFEVRDDGSGDAFYALLAGPEFQAEHTPEKLTANQQWASKQITMSFGAIISVFFLGLFASVREIVKELEVYRHERFINLQIVPYVLSKYMVLALLNAIQAFLILVVLDGLGSWTEGPFAQRFIILFATALAGTSLGLAISAAVSSSEWAVNLMIAVVIPQTLFSGAFVDMTGLSEIIGKVFVVTFWGVEACRSFLPDVITHASTPHVIARPDSFVLPLAVILAHAALTGSAAMLFLSAKDGPGVLARLAKPLVDQRLRS